MTDPSLGQIVAETFAKSYTEPQPYHHVLVKAKSGKLYYKASTSPGWLIIEYVKDKAGRSRRGYFDLVCKVPREDGAVYVFAQRVGRSQPRFDAAPDGWRRYLSGQDLPVLPPPEPPMSEGLFTSSVLFNALRK